MSKYEEAWGTAEAVGNETPDILIENNGTLRLYTKNRAFEKNLIIGVSVKNSDDFREVQQMKLDELETSPETARDELTANYFFGNGDPSATKLTSENWRQWFVDVNQESNVKVLYEVIRTAGIYRALPYRLKNNG